MAEKVIRVLLLEPGKFAREAEIDASLAGMQSIVGGHIEAIFPFDEPVCIVCNDEGKLLGLPLNRGLRDEDGELCDIISGTCFLCDCSSQEFKSLSDEQLQHYKEQFLQPERFVRCGESILAKPYVPELYQNGGEEKSMKLESIPYLHNQHMLGCSPIPPGYTMVISHPVRDENGRCGVLLRAEHTGIYTLFVGGKACCLQSVDQQEAQRLVEKERQVQIRKAPDRSHER